MKYTGVDWGRAVLIGAVAGGAFWALATSSIMATHGSPVAYSVTGVLAVGAILLGSIAYRSSESTRNRCWAIGVILAPLTGATTLIVFCLGALVIHAVS